MLKITMKDLLSAGVHFGHKSRFWNPQMKPYIYGVRQRMHIINLDETLPRMHEALKYVYELASNRGKLLFVGTKHATRRIVKEEAIRCGMPYVDYRWLGGMLTNYKTIRQSIKRLKDLEALADSKAYESFTKKEKLAMEREKNKLALNLDGIKNMGGLPDALFVIDVGNEKIAIQEAKRLGIKVIGIVDSNNSPDDVDYLIPGNDDAQRAVRLYCKSFADTIIAARGTPEEIARREAEKQKTAKVSMKKAQNQPTATGTGSTTKEENLPLVENDLVVEEKHEKKIKTISKPKAVAVKGDVDAPSDEVKKPVKAKKVVSKEKTDQTHTDAPAKKVTRKTVTKEAEKKEPVKKITRKAVTKEAEKKEPVKKTTRKAATKEAEKKEPVKKTTRKKKVSETDASSSSDSDKK